MSSHTPHLHSFHRLLTCHLTGVRRSNRARFDCGTRYSTAAVLAPPRARADEFWERHFHFPFVPTHARVQACAVVDGAAESPIDDREITLRSRVLWDITPSIFVRQRVKETMAKAHRRA